MKVKKLAGKSFNNLKELENYIMSKINESLKHDVAPIVKDEIESSVLEMLNEYDPIYYNRRSSSNSLGSGGLADKNTITSEVSNGTLSVTPQADFNYDFAENHGFPSIYGNVDYNKSLVSNIIGGYGDKSHPWNRPRDFVEDTRKNLRRNKNHVESMKDGLRAKGIEVL